MFTQLLSSVEKDNKRLHDEWLQTAINYKVEWDEELERRRKLGIQAPDPTPHPDHVVIDMQTGSATGPMTKEERAKWDTYEAYKADALWEVGELRKILKSESDPDGKAEIQKFIDQIEGEFEKLETRVSERFGGLKARRK